MGTDLAKAYVDAVIEAGGDIVVVGPHAYVIARTINGTSSKSDEVLDRFGNVTHLKKEIIAYLRKLGRTIEGE
ncbi:hypothetical protein J2W42_005889 [Rhizobium tibeticum]|uniref:hypothetical protein n=1 Tax=Rhizobium tibeticum TaxID=501024 RepID=UPI0027807775|nr:hypothetical protein [Rhizobium tibeticum]MDP9813018.1 hypothetical protein [Rhizobium tibeticum]